ncbi:hypothetical protein SUGI_0053230 [Cryptomeria japonica]|nr:hypothetical protein SUGI_0053230 [Cryptomeria japonica]
MIFQGCLECLIKYTKAWIQSHFVTAEGTSLVKQAEDAAANIGEGILVELEIRLCSMLCVALIECYYTLNNCDWPWHCKFKDDLELYVYPNFKYIGIELLKVKLGTLFDNILVSNDPKYAKKLAEEIWGKKI